MHRSEFLNLLREQLPELRDALNRQEGLLQFEVGELRLHAQRAIFEGNRAALEVCFRVASEAYLQGNKKLRTAIDTAFVENLDFITLHKSYHWAWEMMPSELQRLYRRFMAPARFLNALKTQLVDASVSVRADIRADQKGRKVCHGTQGPGRLERDHYKH